MTLYVVTCECINRAINASYRGQLAVTIFRESALYMWAQNASAHAFVCLCATGCPKSEYYNV